MGFEIIIGSPPDREKVVAEIWYDSEQVVEISNEREGVVEIEIYPSPSGEAWHFDFAEFMTVLARAKARLLCEDTT